MEKTAQKNSGSGVYPVFYQYCILDCGGAWAVWNTAACGLCFYGNVTGVQYQYYFINIFTG